MDKNTIYTLIPYVILALIITVFLTAKINSCNTPETVRLTRDSVKQEKIDSVKIIDSKYQDTLRVERNKYIVLEGRLETLEAVYKVKRKINSEQTTDQRFNNLKKRIQEGLKK